MLDCPYLDNIKKILFIKFMYLKRVDYNVKLLFL